MEIRFNVTGEDRKALVMAVSGIAGREAVYMKAPSFAYTVGNYTIDKNGTLVFDERTGTEDVCNLLTGLAERGFAFEGDIDEIVPVVSASVEDGLDASASGEAESDGESSGESENERTPRNGDPFADVPNSEVSAIETPDRLVIEMPLGARDSDGGFIDGALYNLERLVESKAALIRKAIGASELPIVRENDRLCFPWFSPDASAEETAAYTQFVAALCTMAKKQKRVTAKEKPADSEKFAFRCFLLRLGFIGAEYAAARKILLRNLSGNGSFKSGDHKRGAMPEGTAAADSVEVNVEAISVRESETDADSAATGGEVARYA